MLLYKLNNKDNKKGQIPIFNNNYYVYNLLIGRALM